MVGRVREGEKGKEEGVEVDGIISGVGDASEPRSKRDVGREEEGRIERERGGRGEARNEIGVEEIIELTASVLLVF